MKFAFLFSVNEENIKLPSMEPLEILLFARLTKLVKSSFFCFSGRKSLKLITCGHAVSPSCFFSLEDRGLNHNLHSRETSSRNHFKKWNLEQNHFSTLALLECDNDSLQFLCQSEKQLDWGAKIFQCTRDFSAHNICITGPQMFRASLNPVSGQANPIPMKPERN